MKLTLEGIKDCELWNKAGITLPGYDVEKVSQKAKEEPKWVHFGIGNIFRIFIGGIADGLVGEGHRVAGDKRQIAVLSVIIVVDGGDAIIAGDGCHHRAVFHDLGDGGLVRRADQIGRDDDAVFVGVAVCLRYHGVAALLHDPLGSLGQQGVRAALRLVGDDGLGVPVVVEIAHDVDVYAVILHA